MKIENIQVNKILDSRGEWTIEVEIEIEGVKEKASIPSGKSVGSHEAICLDCEKIEKNLPEFLKEIKNFDFSTSQEFDNFLIERAGKNKERLGANFVLGCSISFARILAKKSNLDLCEYLKGEYLKTITENNVRISSRESSQEFATENNVRISQRFIVNIIGGGVHSFNNLDFQEYWLVSQEEFSEKLIADVLSVINNIEKILPRPLGRNDEGAFCTNFSDNYEPFIYLNQFKENFELGTDIAANQIKNLVNWKSIYEKLKILNVIYLEDPYKEDEFEKFAELKKEGFKVVGDDLTVTNFERLKIAIEKDSVNGVIVKPNQIGTIKETFEFVKLAKENNLFTIFSHRSGETNDNWIIDLGIAFEADYFKIGVPLQGERVAKWNRLFEIFRKLKFSPHL
ncbi:MAG: hypothetical protein QXG91_03895 [Candidatus Aenigmatarchaeota archaeon]